MTEAEIGLLGVPDPSVLAYAHAESRVIVTSDRDYLRLDAAGAPHSGIVFCRQKALSIGEMIEYLLFICGAKSPDEMIGYVEYI